jgi:hypothetical protein
MKDFTFTLTGKRIRREVTYLLAAVLLANGLNVYAIVSRKTAWSELLTCLPFVLGLALVFYAAWTLPRLGWFALRSLLGKRRHPDAG